MRRSNMIVCKFGGSSLADEKQFRKVKAIIESDSRRTIAVVSAPGKRDSSDEKITDMLYQCNALAQKNQSCRPVFDKIASRYIGIAEALRLDVSRLTAALDEVRQNIDAGRGTDYAASRGEYLSGQLMAQYLGWQFIEPAECIVINSDGTVNPLSYERLANLISDGGHYVIPGFYGATEQGVIKTFSRGGSDISGAIAARAAKAELYENWTDVSGMYAADPRIVPDAKVIDEITYTQVRELSDVGASVFHEEAIAPVIDLQIPINIRNTNDPDAPGTVIKATSEKSGIIGVSAKGGYSKLKLRKLMMFKRPGMRHAMLTMLHLYGVRPSFSFFGIDSIVWYFESSQANDSVLTSMIDRLKKDFRLDYVYYERNHAMLGIVGGHLEDDTSFITACAALRDAGIKINSVNYGSSNATTLIGVNDCDAKRAVEVIYRALFS